MVFLPGVLRDRLAAVLAELDDRLLVGSCGSLFSCESPFLMAVRDDLILS
jgi:hypothetical protein